MKALQRVVPILVVLSLIAGLGFVANATTQPASDAMIVQSHGAAAISAQPVAASDTVYITNTGAKYHRGSCRHLAKSKIAIKRSDAIKQGYGACKVCKP